MKSKLTKKKKTQISNISKFNKEEDYYHVDTNKITDFIYNYSTGFVETLKKPKYKISQCKFRRNNWKI